MASALLDWRQATAEHGRPVCKDVGNCQVSRPARDHRRTTRCQAGWRVSSAYMNRSYAYSYCLRLFWRSAAVSSGAAPGRSAPPSPLVIAHQHCQRGTERGASIRSAPDEVAALRQNRHARTDTPDRSPAVRGAHMPACKLAVRQQSRAGSGTPECTRSPAVYRTSGVGDTWHAIMLSLLAELACALRC